MRRNDAECDYRDRPVHGGGLHGRIAGLGIALLAGFVQGCDRDAASTQDGGPSDEDPTAHDAGQDAADATYPCRPEVEIHGVGDVVPALGGEWPFVGPYTSAVLPVTADLRARGEVTLEAAEVPVGGACAENGGCRSVARFLLDSDAVAGVTLEGGADPDFEWLETRPRLRVLDGARFRLRPMFLDTHPEIYSFVTVLLVLPSCATPCVESHRRCAKDEVCYRLGVSHCNRCDALGVRRCACVGPSSVLPDGTPCEYAISGDVFLGGECRDGMCE